MTKQKLDCVFQPKTVAIAGVSTKQTTVPSLSQRYLRAVREYGFKGRVYPLNPKGGEIWGLKIYPNIKDIPEPVDYVISCIPASATPQLIKECAVKGVKVIHFYTSGFSEAGTDEGRRLENEIYSLARQNGMRIIGPNCMGVYSPKANFSFVSDFPKESGSVALICQSGGNTNYIVREGANRGVRFSKVISYGNAVDINESDLLEYLTFDADTEIITAYIEGVKNGKRFSQALREAAKVKPVIVLKSGITESGAKVAASHVSALAGSNEIWDGFLRQVGAIRANSLDELIDMAMTFSYLPLLAGRRVSILGTGGGVTVLAADDCINAGLTVPRFSEGIYNKLKNLLKTEAGVILNNPVDLATGVYQTGIYDVLNTLINCGEFDLHMLHFALGLIGFSPSLRNRIWDSIVEDAIRVHKESAKPVVVVIHSLASNSDYEWMLEAQRKCCEAGIPVYHSMSSAAKAIDRFLRYHELRLTRAQD